jgi:hypothetical protein
MVRSVPVAIPTAAVTPAISDQGMVDTRSGSDTVTEPPDRECRRVIVATCERRAALELRGAAAFTGVTQALLELRADRAILELSARAIVEEMNHSEIYRSLAATYAEREVPPPLPGPIEWPAHEEAPPALRPALHVVGMCAINETMACSFLELCLAGARAPAVRRGLREVLGDEIRHGRIGWAWLASAGLSARTRSAIGGFVLPLLLAQVRGWRVQIATVPAPAAPEYGCPSGPAIEAAMVASIANLVLPGFEHVGIDVMKARAWTEDGAPT